MSSSPEHAREAGDAEVHHEELHQRLTTLVSSWPSFDGLSPLRLYRHAGEGWCSSLVTMIGAMVTNACFAARPSDIVIATVPKSGTTWMKALVYATVRRSEHPAGGAGAGDHPFHSLGPHECVKSFEFQLYTGGKVVPDGELHELPDPRLFATHVPFVSLPSSAMAAGCKIVYVCRDLKDTFVSLWHFMNRLCVMKGLEPLSLEVAVEHFTAGESPFGPYWEHILGYWRAHQEHPERVLFFRYEEMMREPAAHVRRLAEFVDRPFTTEEEESGTADAIVKLCSFEHLSNLEANKSGQTELVIGAVKNSSFFRRGLVGDWANHLSPEMAQRIDAITEVKFRGSGLRV